MTEPANHPAFERVRSTPIESLNVTVHEFRHKATGAQHLHIATDDDQNAFMVGFRTVPTDSTGVAHILEHTALCGSRRYPVRDPFFMMIRRSLNTFMNAFTSSDWTAYPFASRNRKDFYNLLEVYLDAVFFPTLHELDFAQEGHRVEFEKPADPESDLTFKGVVFNEMKGAMSSPVATLYQEFTSYLFPTITYHHNSGGDPACIPDLTHEDLKAFHAAHYHPSNAVLLTYGDMSPDEHQRFFEERALGEFERKDLGIAVPDEKRYEKPVAVEGTYAIDPSEDPKDKTHVVVGWLLGKSTDAEEVLTAHLLSGVLLDNSASPLRNALETTDLGDAPSPMCGLQDSTREMFFSAGLEGSNPENAEAVEELILSVLEDVAENGVDREMVESVLHQLELHQREVGGDGLPYGLQLMVHAMAPALHGADPVAALDIDPVLKKLRERIAEPGYIKGLVRELLENSHRVRLVMKPDTELARQRQQAEEERLAGIKAEMDDAAKQRVVEQAEALAARQAAKDDPSILPKVSLEDIPKELAVPEGTEAEVAAAMPATGYDRNTNGIVYQELVVELPDMDPDLADLLPLYCECLPDVGSGGRTYLETQALQAAVTGGIGARSTVRGAVDDVSRTRGVFVVSGKALARNHDGLAGLMEETLLAPRFDELRRLREIVAEERLSREQAVTSNGHALAMAAAASRMSPSAQLAHRWQGLDGVKTVKLLDDALDDNAALEAFAGKLERIRDALAQAPRQLLVIGEADDRGPMLDALRRRWHGRPAPIDGRAFEPAVPGGRTHHAWSTSTQVNFCAKAYPAVPPDHEDAAALMVLGGFLRNNFLHTAIREKGGAYGGGASYDGDAGAFRFFSYRDPRLAETLSDFDRALDWLLSGDHEWRLIEESILGVIGAIDKPASPAGEARKAFHGALHGRTPEQRRRVRARVLEVRQEDLKRVAGTYLRPELAHTAVVSDAATLEENADLGLEIVKL